MTQFELQLLVKRVVKDFSEKYDIKVTDYAIEEIIKPAIPHLANVTESLNQKKITTPFLEDSIRTILRNARAMAIESRGNYIGLTEIQKSMEKDCPYLFWC